jgi:8-oxo-dGTP diphosphatase
MLVVAAIIERPDRHILIGQRRRSDTSPLKWEFPGGKVRDSENESPEVALSRELREELGATLTRCTEIARAQHHYAATAEPLEIRFYAAEIENGELSPAVFEQIAWVLPKDLGAYDFLAANAHLVADIATGRIKPAEMLDAAGQQS